MISSVFVFSASVNCCCGDRIVVTDLMLLLMYRIHEAWMMMMKLVLEAVADR